MIKIIKEKIEWKYFLTLSLMIKNNNNLVLNDIKNDLKINYILKNGIIENDMNERIIITCENDNKINFKSFWKKENKLIEKNLDIEKFKLIFVYNYFELFMNELKKEYKDINYVWSMEIKDMIYYYILITKIDELENLENKIRSFWNKVFDFINLNSVIMESVENSKIINFIFKLPVLIGYNENIVGLIDEYLMLNINRLTNDFYEIVLSKKIIYDKYNTIIGITLLEKMKENKEFQNRRELIYIEKSIRKQEITKHFFNYFGRLLKKEVFNIYVKHLIILFENKLNKITDEKKRKQDIEFLSFLLMRNRCLKDVNRINNRICYQFLISIFTLFYVHSENEIKRDITGLCIQIGKLFFSGRFEEYFDALKKTYVFTDKMTEMELKNKFFSIIGVSIYTFFDDKKNFPYLTFKRVDNIKVIISFNENSEIIKELKVTKKKIYSQNFPLFVKPKNWEKLNGSLSDNCTGGLLNNGKLFNSPLSNAKKNRDLKAPSGKIIDSINYLQTISFEIDCFYLDYLNKNKWVIEDKYIKLDIIDEKSNNVEFARKIAKLSYDSKKEVWNTTIDLLNFYKVYEKFYFIYQLDFRGRIYVVSDYLNYQTNKICRGILKYHKKFKHTEVDLFWFKIATTRKFLGSVKQSADWFINYFDKELNKKIINWIYYKEDNYFWLLADEPFLFLGYLFEWSRYYLFKETFISSMIVYFDATCSGSQIISLIFGFDKYIDSLNLKKSNSSDKIQDYYLAVMNDFLFLCEEKYKKFKFFFLLNKMEKKVLRNIFKKIIMTINYGLTKKGLKYKFIEQLKDYNLYSEWSDYVINMFIKVFYGFLSNLILVKSLNVLKKYLEYIILQDKQFVINTSFKGFIKNSIDSDLVVMFPYYKKEVYKFKYSLSKQKVRKRKKLSLVFSTKVRDLKKEILAFKANFIHHMDSMILYSVLYESMLKNINICTIHDSFGIQLKNINEFNIFYRQCLITLFNDENNFIKYVKYSIKKDVNNEDILNDIYKELELLIKDRNDAFIKDLKNSFYCIFP